MKSIVIRFVLVVMALTVFAHAGEVESGLQIGDYAQAFYVTDVTGPSAGEELCYRCRYSARPVISIFARGIDDDVRKLVKGIDGLVGQHKDEQLAAFVVLLTDRPLDQEAKLKAAAKDSGIVNTPLTTYKDMEGPHKYRIHKDADVTVMMWVEGEVKVNHVFTKGKLSANAIRQVVADTSKILE